MKWVSTWLGRHEQTRESTRKTIDTAAVKAEAEVLVGEIRANLDRIEELVNALPSLPDDVRETGSRDPRA